MVVAYIAIVLETLLVVFIIWGIINKVKLLRIEHAFCKAVIWELYERFAERDVNKMRANKYGSEEA